MRFYSENSANFNLQNALLEAIEVHNNKLRTVNQFNSIDLIYTKDEDLIRAVLDNKKECIKVGKRLVTKKNKIRAIKLIGTVTANYGNGLYFIHIDEDYNNFDYGEEIFAYSKQFLDITNEEWSAIKNSRIDIGDKTKDKISESINKKKKN